MSPAEGTNMSRAETDRIQLLDWIYTQAGQRAGHAAPLDSLFEGRDYDRSFELTAQLEDLERSHLLRGLDRSLGWPDICILTSEGARAVEAVHRARRDMAARYTAAQDALLAWLFECLLQDDTSPQLDDFHDSPHGSYYADPFTPREVTAATRALKAEDYITGDEGYGEGVVRPVLTAPGRRLVQDGLSVRRGQAPQGGTVNHITTGGDGSPVTLMQDSPGARQTVTVTLTPATAVAVTDIADRLTALLPDLPEDRRAEVADLADDLRDELDTAEPRPGLIRRKLTRAMTLLGTGLATGTGAAASTEIVKLAADVLTQLPT